MKNPGREILTAVVMGLLVPAAVLSLAVKLIPEKAPALPAEPEVTTPSVREIRKISVLTEDGAVVEMALDDYLTGVLLAEMPASFEPEALKAQAVVSRTYALRREARPTRHPEAGVCTSPACCQAYLSPEAYLAGGGNGSDVDKIRAAVEATSGQVLTWQGQLIEATFFSCSGGSTEDAVAVWGSDVPYLRAVPSPGEEEAAHYSDTVTFSRAELENALGISLSGPADTWFSDILYTAGGGIASLTAGGRTFTGVEMRQALNLRSTDMEFSPAEDSVTVTTHGYGHRVGMSQYGAQAMAEGGSTYDEILAYYYAGTQLEVSDS